MKAILTIWHSREPNCSGVTIMDNGTKVYWTYDQPQYLVIHATGGYENIDKDRCHPINVAMDDSSFQPQRKATVAEESEIDIALAPIPTVEDMEDADMDAQIEKDMRNTD